jgi:dihydrofolate reductase
MAVEIVVAAALDHAIGKKNDVPWHLPGDLKRFKARTKGKTVVMGRRTWESIGSRPLPGRRNLVVSRTPGLEAPGAEVVASLHDAIAVASDVDVCVLGGAGIYAAALAIADRIALSLVHTTVADADTWFPDPGEGWVVDERTEHHDDAWPITDFLLSRRHGPHDPRPPFVWPTQR